VRKKGRVLAGFREKQGDFLADMQHCEVLHPSIGEKIEDFQTLIFACVLEIVFIFHP